MFDKNDIKDAPVTPEEHAQSMELLQQAMRGELEEAMNPREKLELNHKLQEINEAQSEISGAIESKRLMEKTFERSPGD